MFFSYYSFECLNQLDLCTKCVHYYFHLSCFADFVFSTYICNHHSLNHKAIINNKWIPINYFKINYIWFYIIWKKVIWGGKILFYLTILSHSLSLKEVREGTNAVRQEMQQGPWRNPACYGAPIAPLHCVLTHTRITCPEVAW